MSMAQPAACEKCGSTDLVAQMLEPPYSFLCFDHRQGVGPCV